MQIHVLLHLLSLILLIIIILDYPGRFLIGLETLCILQSNWSIKTKHDRILILIVSLGILTDTIIFIGGTNVT